MAAAGVELTNAEVLDGDAILIDNLRGSGG